MTRVIQLLSLLVSLLAFDRTPARGQGGTVVGTVRTRESAHPVRGAQVRLPGTTLSATSGVRGDYRIVGAPPGQHAMLVTSRGHVPVTLVVTIPPNDSVTLDVELRRAAQSESGPVVLLTGDHNAVALGGTLARIDAESLARAAPVQTFSELLMGRSPGVLVMPSSGTAGTGSQVTMRGVANPYVSVAPLVYVDGVRVEANPRAFTLDVGGQTPSRLDDLDPATLQSVDMLRGPAAAAIYGAEATNGVMLVTTREGAPGPIRFRAFTTQGSTAEAVRFPDNVRAVTATGVACPMDEQALGQCSAQRILRSNPLENSPASPIAAGAVRAYGVEAAGSAGGVRFALGADIRSDAGIYHLPQVEVQRLGATYGQGSLRDDVLDPNHLRRSSLYATATATPAKNLEVSASARYLSSSLRLPINDNASGLLVNGLLGSPDSTPGGQWLEFRPGEIFQVGSTQGIDRWNGSVSARFRPAFLELRGVLGEELVRQHDTQLLRAGEGPVPDSMRQGFVADNSAKTHHLTAILSAAAAERFGTKITGRTTVGVEYSRVSGDTLLEQGSGLAHGATMVSQADSQSSRSVSDHTSNTGYLLEQELSHGGRLFVEGALRWDHASGSGSAPAAVLDAAAWASWVVPLRAAGAFQWLRIRGATGTVARRSPFPLPTPFMPAGGGPVPPPPPPPNPERTAESELGADIQLLDGRLGFAVTSYGKRTSGFVTFFLPPPTSGFHYELINGGEIWNQGVELELTAEPLRSEQATLDVRFGAWGNRSRVANLTAFLPRVGIEQFVFQGYPLGPYYAIQVQGLRDANGDGVLTPKEISLSDIVPVGSPLPTQGASASVALSWHRWVRFSTVFEYRGGGSLPDGTAASRCQLTVCSARSVPGTPLAEQARALADDHTAWGLPEDAGFVKLRELSVTLSAPGRWAARIGASELRLTLAGRNVATWTPYGGMDPEVNATGQRGVAMLDYFTQPPVRYWTARLDVEF